MFWIFFATLQILISDYSSRVCVPGQKKIQHINHRQMKNTIIAGEQNSLFPKKKSAINKTQRVTDATTIEVSQTPNSYAATM